MASRRGTPRDPEWVRYGPDPNDVELGIVELYGMGTDGVRVFTDSPDQYYAMARTCYVNSRDGLLRFESGDTARKGVRWFQLEGTTFLAVYVKPQDDMTHVVAACKHSKLHGSWRVRPMGIEKQYF